MDGCTSSSVSLSNPEDPTTFSPFPSTSNFNSTNSSCFSSSVSPFTSSTNSSSTPYFNPSGMPYFPSFPSYPQPYNFPYFPSPHPPPPPLPPSSSSFSLSQWRQLESSFTATPPYSNNTVLNFPSTFPSGIKKRKGRKLYTQAQIDVLVHEFRKNGYVSKEDRVRIGQMTGIPEDKVKIWYQNRRYKEKKEGESTSSEGRRSQSPSAEETKSSSRIPPFPPHLPSESPWLPDLRSHPTSPFAPSIYPPQSFSFFPPHSTYHSFPQPSSQ